MIEQTEMVVTKWEYTQPSRELLENEKILSAIEFDVMRKRNSEKKGIACRFTCTYTAGPQTILTFVGEDSYVIDLQDVVDKEELMRMVHNSYSKFSEKFEFKRLGTILSNHSLMPLNEKLIDTDTILPLLV